MCDQPPTDLRKEMVKPKGMSESKGVFWDNLMARFTISIKRELWTSSHILYLFFFVDLFAAACIAPGVSQYFLDYFSFFFARGYQMLWCKITTSREWYLNYAGSFFFFFFHFLLLFILSDINVHITVNKDIPLFVICMKLEFQLF